MSSMRLAASPRKRRMRNKAHRCKRLATSFNKSIRLDDLDCAQRSTRFYTIVARWRDVARRSKEEQSTERSVGRPRELLNRWMKQDGTGESRRAKRWLEKRKPGPSEAMVP